MRRIDGPKLISSIQQAPPVRDKIIHSDASVMSWIYLDRHCHLPAHASREKQEHHRRERVLLPRFLAQRFGGKPKNRRFTSCFNHRRRYRYFFSNALPEFKFQRTLFRYDAGRWPKRLAMTIHIIIKRTIINQSNMHSRASPPDSFRRLNFRVTCVGFKVVPEIHKNTVEGISCPSPASP